ncbi:MAG: DUF4926 domain-containing protein [Lacipirellulaceae bacterium]
MIAEHEVVVLTCDLPAHALRAGDVGAVVYVHDQGAAYELEFVGGSGATVAVVTVEASLVRPIAATEILHARTISAA